MSLIEVMQVVDSLDSGGMELMAVTIANALPRDRFSSHICTTRYKGVLENRLGPHVRRLDLDRWGRFDPRALFWLVRYLRRSKIDIIHAHGTALFLCAAARLACRSVVLVWHDHFGGSGVRTRPRGLYRIATRGVALVISVNKELAEWASHELGIPRERIRYLANFVESRTAEGSAENLPGVPGMRLVCVANMKPAKDHFTLLRAMEIVVASQPQAHLLLLGGGPNMEYVRRVRDQIDSSGLQGAVTVMGIRDDIAEVLAACDIGVLSSASEGLPMALLEYGRSGLPSVVTDVGQCSEVVDRGAAGFLVPPHDPEALAKGILRLLASPVLRRDLGLRLRERVEACYGLAAGMSGIVGMYTHLIERRA